MKDTMTEAETVEAVKAWMDRFDPKDAVFTGERYDNAYVIRIIDNK